MELDPSTIYTYITFKNINYSECNSIVKSLQALHPCIGATCWLYNIAIIFNIAPNAHAFSLHMWPCTGFIMDDHIWFVICPSHRVAMKSTCTVKLWFYNKLHKDILILLDTILILTRYNINPSNIDILLMMLNLVIWQLLVWNCATDGGSLMKHWNHLHQE